MKRFKEYTGDLITEAKFTRLPKQLNAMWELKNAVDSIVGKHDNGDDYNPAEMKTIEEFIKKIKKSAKSFKDAEEVKGTVYESTINEAKDDYVARYKDTNIFLKKGYKHLNDEELNQLYLEIGELISDNKLMVKNVTIAFE